MLRLPSAKWGMSPLLGYRNGEEGFGKIAEI